MSDDPEWRDLTTIQRLTCVAMYPPMLLAYGLVRLVARVCKAVGVRLL